MKKLILLTIISIPFLGCMTVPHEVSTQFNPYNGTYRSIWSDGSIQTGDAYGNYHVVERNGEASGGHVDTTTGIYNSIDSNGNTYSGVVP